LLITRRVSPEQSKADRQAGKEFPKQSIQSPSPQKNTKIMASLASTALPKILPSCPKIPSIISRPCPPQSLTTKQRIPLVGIGRRIFQKTAIKATAPTGSSSPGLHSAQQFELNPQNVDLVLEEVRPYLISDGGNVDVVSVEDGVITLKLQGHFFFTRIQFFLTFFYIYIYRYIHTWWVCLPNLNE